MRDQVIVLLDRLVEHGLSPNQVEDEEVLLRELEAKAIIEEEEEEVVAAEVKVDDEEAEEVIVTEVKVDAVDHTVETEHIERHVPDHLEGEKLVEQEVNLQFLILLIKDEKKTEFLNFKDADRNQNPITVDIVVKIVAVIENIRNQVEESHVPAVVRKKKLFMFQYISQLLHLCRTHKK